MELYIKELVSGNINYFLENIGKDDVPHFWNVETFRRLYEKNIALINELDEENKIKKIFELLVVANTHNVVFVPKKFLTRQMCKNVVVVGGGKILALNKAFKPEFHAMIVFELYPSCIHQYSLATYISKEEWLEKVKINFSYIRYIPKDYLNQDICNDAIKDNPNLIKHIPEKYRTKSICLIAYNHDYRNIKYVLEEYKTKDMCWKTIKEDVKSIHFFSKELRTLEMYEYIAEKNPSEIKSIPEEFVNRNIINIAKENNALTPLIVDIMEAEEFIDGYIAIKYDKINKYMASKKVTYKILDVLVEIVKKFNPDLYEKYVLKTNEFNINIIKDYIAGNYTGKKQFFEHKNITEHQFLNAANYVKKADENLYSLYMQRAALNQNNYNSAVEETIKFVKKALYAKNKKLNSVTYYLKTNINPAKILMELGKTTATGRRFNETILMSHKNSYNASEIKSFMDGTYIKDGKHLSMDTKKLIVKFLLDNKIPANAHTLNIALSMHYKGTIDITKVYEKEIMYEGMDDELVKISVKLGRINTQEDLLVEMNSLEDNILMKLDEKIRKNGTTGKNY